jgi:polyribonucleotide nucleotidyltransferase
MDFKVAGTADGITALQMDIKINGITEAIMTVALQQALAGRKHILDRMSAAIAESRPEIVGNAPQIRSIQIPREKIGELIGPGGKMIKSIIEQTGAKIDISDDGRVNIAAMKSESMNAALEMVQEIVAMAEVGRVYRGKVVKLMDFGAFVAITKGSEGLVHVSEMALHPVKHPRDVLSEGQIIDVKVLEVDPKNGKIRLSMKALMNADASGEDAQDSDSDVAELTLEEGSAEAKKSGVKSMGAGTKKRMKKPAEGRDRDQQQEVDKDSVAKDKRRPDRSDSNTSSSNTNAGRKLRFF